MTPSGRGCVKTWPRLCKNTVKIRHRGTAPHKQTINAGCVSTVNHNRAFCACSVLCFLHRKFCFDVFTQPRPVADPHRIASERLLLVKADNQNRQFGKLVVERPIRGFESQCCQYESGLLEMTSGTHCRPLFRISVQCQDSISTGSG
jgi:hypothetical protein